MDFKGRRSTFIREQMTDNDTMGTIKDRASSGYFFALVESCLGYLCAFLFIAGGFFANFPALLLGCLGLAGGTARLRR
ncbi:hypothetical protein EDC04DRAFT_2756927 [Pisolithus marmoratus]|nr:hypothetical protein EDC04DRAFT_2756927 [Pisolithus marmoratus]